MAAIAGTGACGHLPQHAHAARHQGDAVNAAYPHAALAAADRGHDARSDNDLFARLPRDVLYYLLQECDDAARSVLSLSCCSSTLKALASDSALWGALLRRRHRALFGESADPHQTLLPSAARVPSEASAAPRHSRRRGSHESSPKPRWPALYQVCEREWLEALAEPSSGAPWTIWLAWQRRFAPDAGRTQWSLALQLFLGAELEGRANASARSNNSDAALGLIALMVCAVSLCAWWLDEAVPASVF